MHVLKSYGSIDIGIAEEEDKDAVYSLLDKLLVTGTTQSIIDRNKRVLEAKIRHYTKTQDIYCASGNNGITICIIMENGEYPTILHIGTSEMYSVNTLRLMEYLLFTMYGDEDVYVTSKDISTFKSAVIHISGDSYKINKDKFRKLLSIVNG